MLISLARRRFPQPRRARLSPARLRAHVPRLAARPGETLRYDIHVDGHARQGDVRLFFFHYDCNVGRPSCALSVRNGQAGFFTDEELDEIGGRAVETRGRRPDPAAPRAVDRAAVSRRASLLPREQVAAFCRGRRCARLRPGLRARATHTRTPPHRRRPTCCLFDEVDRVRPDGRALGPRLSARRRCDVTPGRWFFHGHFKNDPCMPGTLMFEGCLQAMAFYLAAWASRSTATAGASSRCPSRPYQLRCRGQVTPTSNATLVYEVFVERGARRRRAHAYADLLCTVDGLQGVPLPAHRPAARAGLAARAPTHLAQMAPRRSNRWRRTRASATTRRRCSRARRQPVGGVRPALRAASTARAASPRLPGAAVPLHLARQLAQSPTGRHEGGRRGRGRVRRPGRRVVLRAHRQRHDAVRACCSRPRCSRAAGWRRTSAAPCTRPTRSFFRNLDGKGTLHRAVRPTTARCACAAGSSRSRAPAA